MFSTMLFVIAFAAMAQFALYYWRAVFTGVASLPISERVLEAARVQQDTICGNDFEKLAGLHSLTPELKSTQSSLRLVKLYYGIVSQAQSLLGSISPALQSVMENERVLCARFAAVQIERRLQSNLLQAASIRSC